MSNIPSAEHSRQGGQAPAERGRIESVDVARAVALFAMAIYHFTWDLEFFGYVQRGLTGAGGWMIFARTIASSFLFLVGFSLVLAHARGVRWRSFLTRIAQVVAGALAITLVTVFVTPESFVFFGILHEIAFASLAGLLFLRLPWFVTLAIGLGVIALPNVFRSAFFDPMGLVWIGLYETPPFSNDFVPVFPFFGVVLTGIAMGRLANDHDLLRVLRRLDPKLGAFKRLSWLGRHSLSFYLLHQPILFGIVAAFAQVAPPDPLVSFQRDCRATCLETRDEAFCQRYCACTQERLSADQLLAPLLRGTASAEEMVKVQSIVGVCSRQGAIGDEERRPSSE